MQERILFLKSRPTFENVSSFKGRKLKVTKVVPLCKMAGQSTHSSYSLKNRTFTFCEVSDYESSIISEK